MSKVLNQSSQFIGVNLDKVIQTIERLAVSEGKSVEVRSPNRFYATVYNRNRIQVHIDDKECVSSICEG